MGMFWLANFIDHLQSRDPFSGDCNEKEKQRGLVAPIPVSGRLQRDT